MFEGKSIQEVLESMDDSFVLVAGSLKNGDGLHVVARFNAKGEVDPEDPPVAFMVGHLVLSMLNEYKEVGQQLVAPSTETVN